jgi:hypothetical protein
MWRQFRAVALSGTVVLALFGTGGSLRAQEEGETIQPRPDIPTTRVGTRGASFLEIPVGARASALAGAGTVVSEGVHALYWNVAGTAELESFAFGVSYADLYGASGIKQTFIAATLPLLGGNVGVSLNQLTSGDIPRTREEIPSGEDPTIGNVFDWTSSAAGLHYARMITDRLAVGATGKFIQEGIDDAKASWFAADVGLKFRTGLMATTVAAAVVNLGGRARMEGALAEEHVAASVEYFETDREIAIKKQTTDVSLPTLFRFGIQTDVTGTPEALLSGDPKHRVLALVDILDATDTDIEMTVAMEYSFNELFFARAGKRWFNEEFADRDFADGLSWGLGVRIPAFGRGLAFDYAYTDQGNLDNTQVFSFEFGF